VLLSLKMEKRACFQNIMLLQKKVPKFEDCVSNFIRAVFAPLDFSVCEDGTNRLS